jgi:Tfp pilus assembly protein PilO
VTSRFATLSPRGQALLVGGALLLVTVMGWFVLIAPKRTTASNLKKQTAEVQAQINRNRSAGFSHALPAVRAASVFRVAKAMPNAVEMPNVILQLSLLAQQSGISFDQVSPGVTNSVAGSIAPTTPDTTDPFAADPIEVTFTGSFYDLLSFLQRVRNLVRVENGRLDATGRLFDITDIEYCELNSTGGAGASCSTTPLGTVQPRPGDPVHATLTLNAFVPQTPQAATTTTPGSTDTTSTSTSTTGTTTTTSNPTSASPSTSGGTS